MTDVEEPAAEPPPPFEAVKRKRDAEPSSPAAIEPQPALKKARVDTSETVPSQPHPAPTAQAQIRGAGPSSATAGSQSVPSAKGEQPAVKRIRTESTGTVPSQPHPMSSNAPTPPTAPTRKRDVEASSVPLGSSDARTTEGEQPATKRARVEPSGTAPSQPRPDASARTAGPPAPRQKRAASPNTQRLNCESSFLPPYKDTYVSSNAALHDLLDHESTERVNAQLAYSRLQLQYADVLPRLQEQTTQMSKMKAQIGAMEAERANEDARRVKAEEELAQVQAKLDEMQKLLEDERAAHAKTTESRVEDAKTCDELRDAVKGGEEERKGLQAQLQREQEVLTVVWEDSKAIRKELQELKTAHEDCEERLSDSVEEKEGLLGALEREGKQRTRLERTVADLRREVASPFVVPALLDAFSKISCLASDAVEVAD